MSHQDGRNEGIRVLEELICQATVDPSVEPRGPEAAPLGRGMNQGVKVLEEIVLVPGPAEPMELTHARRERLPRLLICAIVSARAIELGSRLPAGFGELDLSEQGIESMISIISRYLLAREIDTIDTPRPGWVRGAVLVDLAILMRDLARPQSVFVAEAKATALEVASRLLRHEGWSPAPETYSEWLKQGLAIDPAGFGAAREYLALLRRFWGWVGPSSEIGVQRDQLERSVAIPDCDLALLSKRCA